MKKTKKFLGMLMSLLVLISLTGCCTYNVDMKVGEDKSVNLSLIYSINTKAMENLPGLEEQPDEDNSLDDSEFSINIEEVKEIYEPKGYTVEEYVNGDEQGVKISKKFANIDDISSEKELEYSFTDVMDGQFNDNQLFTKKNNNYIAKFVFDFSDTEGMVDPSIYGNILKLSFNLTLPQKSISNNATSVSEDGKTLSWTLEYGKLNNVDFEFSFSKPILSNMMYVYIAAGVGSVVILIILVMVLKGRGKKNKKNDNNQPVTQTPVPEVPVNNIPTNNVENIVQDKVVEEVVPVTNNDVTSSNGINIVKPTLNATNNVVNPLPTINPLNQTVASNVVRPTEIKPAEQPVNTVNESVNPAVMPNVVRPTEVKPATQPVNTVNQSVNPAVMPNVVRPTEIIPAAQPVNTVNQSVNPAVMPNVVRPTEVIPATQPVNTVNQSVNPAVMPNVVKPTEVKPIEQPVNTVNQSVNPTVTPNVVRPTEVTPAAQPVNPVNQSVNPTVMPNVVRPTEVTPIANPTPQPNTTSNATMTFEDLNNNFNGQN